MLDEFLAFCREQGWGVAFLAVREADVPLYRERGMHAIYLGDEAILRCDTFTLEGGAMKPVREAVNRVGRDHTFRADARDRGVARAGRAAERDPRARGAEGADERGFTMELGEDVRGEDPDFVLAMARDADERAGRLPALRALLRRRTSATRST